MLGQPVDLQVGIGIRRVGGRKIENGDAQHGAHAGRFEGARGVGSVVDRAKAAFTAGCDMVLVCNDPVAAEQLLAGLDYLMPAISLARIARVHGRGGAESLKKLHHDPRYVAAVKAVLQIGARDGELPLTR